MNGIVSTIAGTVLALLTTPEDVSQAQALIYPAAFMAVGLLFVPLSNMLNYSAASIAHPVHILVAAPVYWLLLDPLQAAAEMKQVNQFDVQMAFIAIGLFVVGAWIAARHKTWRLPEVVREASSISFTGDRLFELSMGAFILAFLRFAIPSQFDFGVMLAAFGSTRWSTPWGRGQFGGWDAFLDHFMYFGFILPCMTVLLSRKLGWKDWRTVSSAIASFIILALLSIDGGRRNLGVMLGSGYVAWFLTAKPPRLKHIFVVVACCSVLLAFMQLTVIYRGSGLLKVFDSAYSETVSKPKHLHVDDNFLRLSQIISIIPEKHPHVTWRWLLWVAVRPVPRIFWPGKPIDPGFDLPTYYGIKGVSLSLSLIGELYLAFGFAGCLVGGWVLGKLAMGLAQLLEKDRGEGAMIIFGTGALALFAGMRSGIDVILMNYGIVGWIILIKVYRLFSPPPPSKRFAPRPADS